MNYDQTKFNPGRKQSPEEMQRWREERKKRLTDLMEEAALNKNKKLVKEYKLLIERL